MDAVHTILFNMLIIYSFLLGVYGTVLAARNEAISGNFWGAMAIFVGLALLTTLVGFINALGGARLADPENRVGIYFLYMVFIVIIMPGLFSMLRGRDDRGAAIAFAVLALFNASVALSMATRGLVTWLPS